MKTQHFIKHVILEVLGCSITAIGAAGCMKMAIGTGTFDALSLCISSMTGLKVGTLSMLINFLFIALQFILLGKQFKTMFLLQIPMSVLLGELINLFYYNVFAHIEPAQYPVRLGLFALFVIIVAIGVSLVMSSGMIGLALEGACLAVADRLNLSFGTVRQAFDFFCITSVILLWFLADASLSVREGTVIMALIFGPMLTAFMKPISPVCRKWIYGTAVSE